MRQRSTRRRFRLLLASATAAAGCLAFAPNAFATVTSEFSDGFLTASSDSASVQEDITVTCDAGNVKVNGGDPGTGPAACADVDDILLIGWTAKNDLDLSGVTTAAFPNVSSTYLAGNGGADVLTGSAIGNGFDGGPGDDTIHGGPGYDYVDFEGTPNDDDIVVGSGVVTNGGVFETDLFDNVEAFNLFGYGGDDTLDAGSYPATLEGDEGNDILLGSPYDDFLDGGDGSDTLTGAAGYNTF